MSTPAVGVCTDALSAAGKPDGAPAARPPGASLSPWRARTGRARTGLGTAPTGRGPPSWRSGPRPAAPGSTQRRGAPSGAAADVARFGPDGTARPVGSAGTESALGRTAGDGTTSADRPGVACRGIDGSDARITTARSRLISGRSGFSAVGRRVLACPGPVVPSPGRGPPIPGPAASASPPRPGAERVSVCAPGARRAPPADGTGGAGGRGSADRQIDDRDPDRDPDLTGPTDTAGSAADTAPDVAPDDRAADGAASSLACSPAEDPGPLRFGRQGTHRRGPRPPGPHGRGPEPPVPGRAGPRRREPLGTVPGRSGPTHLKRRRPEPCRNGLRRRATGQCRSPGAWPGRGGSSGALPGRRGPGPKGRRQERRRGVRGPRSQGWAWSRRRRAACGGRGGEALVGRTEPHRLLPSACRIPWPAPRPARSGPGSTAGGVVAAHEGAAPACADAAPGVPTAAARVAHRTVRAATAPRRGRRTTGRRTGIAYRRRMLLASGFAGSGRGPTRLSGAAGGRSAPVTGSCR